MKKTFHLTILSAFFLVLFSYKANSQKNTMPHLLITDDSFQGESNLCEHPFQQGDLLELKVRSAIFENTTLNPISSCPPIRIQVREMTTNRVIGVSDPVFTWESIDNFGCPCHADFYYESTVTITLDFSFACLIEHHRGVPSAEGGEITVVYEIVEATPDETGTYKPYYIDNASCLEYFFPNDCFPGHAADYSTVSGWCFTCDGYLDSSNLNTLTGGNSIYNDGSLQFGVLPTVEMYPNPFSTELRINYEIEAPALLQLDLYNSKGQLMQHFEVQVEQGSGTLALSTSALPSGVYFSKFWDGKEWQNFKLLKAEK